MTLPNGIVRSVLPLVLAFSFYSASSQAAPVAQTAALPATVVAPVAYSSSSKWSVSPEDHTFREVLQRWSRQAGWTFNPEHWTPTIDIPVTASATFNGDFISAAQDFVSATELGDTPLQPCFYENQVLRVVYFNESCDKMSSH